MEGKKPKEKSIYTRKVCKGEIPFDRELREPAFTHFE